MNAMPDGGTLSLSMEKLDGELIVGITDTGHGIPKDDIENIFDPFYTRACRLEKEQDSVFPFVIQFLSSIQAAFR